MSDFNQQDSDNFFNQFLDDYFAECEEHLAVVRRGLLNLERSIGQTAVDPVQLDELFRAFHTLKGISGMVGLSPAEELAHELEGCLRLLRHREAPLMKNNFDALIEGTRVLGEVIEAHRSHGPLPDITRAVTSLAAFSAESGKKADEDKNPFQTDTQDPRVWDDVKREWKVLFVPTAARAEAGLNINSIRARLLEIGEILRTTPLIEEGEITFEYIVLTDAPDSILDELRSLGLTVTLVELKNDNTPAPEQQSDEHMASVSTTTGNANPATWVRVDLARLDQLMLLVGDLVVTRARLESNLKSIRTSLTSASWRQLQEVNASLGKQLRDLRNDVMRVRMVPIAEVFDRMHFVVRDLARETQKKIRVELSGQETKIDKFLVERLMDPLLHLVRNAISHGIEPETERVRAGKSPEGHLFIRAVTAGELVVIEIGDDGRGIDVSGVAALVPGLELLNQAGEIDSAQLLKTISTPGLSTREAVDRASGRGVGMDVVARAIRELDGSLSLHTEPGRGTRFRIELPLTLAITDALIATVDGQTFAVHRSSVQEVLEIDPASVKVLENNEVILHRDHVLPLVRLSRAFSLKDKAEGLLHAFVIGTGDRATGLVVDKILGLREVVVRSLHDPLTDVRGIAGATELGDGRPILMLDVGELVNRAQRPASI